MREHSPSAEQVLDFVSALASGAADHVSGELRQGRVRSLRFFAFKLGLVQLRDLSGAAVETWLAADRWTCRPAKTALPLPLSAVARLELVGRPRAGAMSSV